MPPGTGTCCCGSSTPTFLCNLGFARPNFTWNDGIPACFKQYGKISLPTPQFENDRSDRGSAGGHTLENASWSTSELTLSKSRDGVDIYVKYDTGIVLGTSASLGITTYRHPVKELYARKGSNVIHLEYVSTSPTSVRLNRFSDDTYNGCFYPSVVGFQSAMLIPGTLAAPIVSIDVPDPGASGWDNGGPAGPGNPCFSYRKDSYYPNSSTNVYDYMTTLYIEDSFCTGSAGRLNWNHAYTCSGCTDYGVNCATETNIESWYLKNTSSFTLVAQGVTYTTPPGWPGTTVWPGEGFNNPHYPAGASWSAGFKGITSSSISGGGSSPIAVAMFSSGCGFATTGAGCKYIPTPCNPQFAAADGSWTMNNIGCFGVHDLTIGVSF